MRRSGAGNKEEVAQTGGRRSFPALPLHHMPQSHSPVAAMPPNDGFFDDQTGACWQCGAPAVAECAYSQHLFANSRRKLDPLGFSVKHGKRWDKVIVPVPRCRGCRSWTWLSWAVVGGSGVAGVILLPILQARLWPQFGAPGWLIAVDIGAAFWVSTLGVALHRRLSGRRSVNSYPPIVTLRRQGWKDPS
jgi:hypothetical protein